MNCTDCQQNKERDYEDCAQEIIDQIIESGLCHAECCINEHHDCMVVWSSGAKEQIAAKMMEELT